MRCVDDDSIDVDSITRLTALERRDWSVVLRWLLLLLLLLLLAAGWTQRRW